MPSPRFIFQSTIDSGCLLSYHLSKINGLVHNYIDWIYIGGRDSVLGTTPGTYHWLDGSAVAANGFNKWLSCCGDPNHGNEDHMAFGCTAHYSAYCAGGSVWVDVLGTLLYPYLCQIWNFEVSN